MEKAIGTHQPGRKGRHDDYGATRDRCVVVPISSLNPSYYVFQEKTFCLILVYLLVLRLLKKMPTFYQRTATLTYLFCDGGCLYVLVQKSHFMLSSTDDICGSVMREILSC